MTKIETPTLSQISLINRLVDSGEKLEIKLNPKQPAALCHGIEISAYMPPNVARFAVTGDERDRTPKVIMKVKASRWDRKNRQIKDESARISSTGTIYTKLTMRR